MKKIFKATVVANNTKYVDSLMVLADDIEEADELISREYKQVEYINPLHEITGLDMEQSQVINIGFGKNDF